jgi:hypothetical protein
MADVLRKDIQDKLRRWVAYNKQKRKKYDVTCLCCSRRSKTTINPSTINFWICMKCQRAGMPRLLYNKFKALPYKELKI